MQFSHFLIMGKIYNFHLFIYLLIYLFKRGHIVKHSYNIKPVTDMQHIEFVANFF